MRDGGNITRPWFFLCVLLLFQLLHTSCFSIGGDTLSMGQSLSVSQTLVSQGSIFELGFFTKFTTTSHNIYLGIRYKNLTEQIIVWVANREHAMLPPLSYSKLEFSRDGNLVLLTNVSGNIIWSTNFVSPTPNFTEAVLLDNGNFVVRDVINPSTIYWQSFDHPTDTWLPGAKLGIDKLIGKTQVLTSWKNSKDPAPGMFSFGIDPVERNQYVIEWNNSKRYWSTGVWNGHSFDSIPEWIPIDFFNYSFISNEDGSYLTYFPSNSSTLARFVLDISGTFLQLTLMAGSMNWYLRLQEPRQLSQVYALCGAFGIYSDNLLINPCECLQGFEPFSMRDIKLDDWSGGCVRETPLQCQNGHYTNGLAQRFSKISDITTLPDNSKVLPDLSLERCESACVQKCSCTAYAYNSSGCLVWEGPLLNLQQLSNGSDTKQDLCLKLAASELRKAGGDKKNLWEIIIVPVSLAILSSGGFICCLIRRKLNKMGISGEKDSGGGKKDKNKDLLLFDFSVSTNATVKTNNGNNLERNGKKDVELPFFSFASVSAATGNFSATNKLGEGGFGPVHKGKLLRGQEIAVKRLSGRSRQGFLEFKNEAVLIAKLQHRNLVRLLGCCIEQDENILIYEYMHNKSLDFFLFDPNRQGILDWTTRIRIIEGIAQGLLYLHQYSRLRIIHRDLKASNILLDSEMNPKISDFGMARIFCGNDSQANTNRIVGTYGYMSPEYAMEGLFSIKSDVFSFGVLLLEIVSGKKNIGFYHSSSFHLLGYTWELWNAGRGMELLDPILGSPSSTSTLLKYINIGLLCVQGNPNDRPTMSDVVSMLGNEYASLPIPKEPTFSTCRLVVNTKASLSNAQYCSVNVVTLSEMEAR
ncbi:receptor-like serine/threonine-protein kinase SD1-8 [Cornus florida]|uniref:receptor-like serine/threonine-protein kinase SD1-8 n=1 Tax=Cornus florida TaxID=4283 RepID=UPI00289D5842|nr:receptor-like serine/threonine-protein kinase SD1-8 [Cornus florida]